MQKLTHAVAAGVTALAVAGGTYGCGAANDDTAHHTANTNTADTRTADTHTANKDVTLSVDGATSKVSTQATTVAGVLSARGITVTNRDAVAPARHARVADGTTIAVRYARPVTVKVDGHQKKAWTTATRVDQALAALKVLTTGATLSARPTAVIGRSGLAIDVATRKTVQLDAAGRRRQLHTTARTVGDLLRVARIHVDHNDKLSAPASAAVRNGMTLTYTRVAKRTLTKHTRVGYDTVHHTTSRLRRGTSEIETSGRSGVRTVTYREVRRNGVVTSLQRTDSAVTRKPRTKVVLVGTKEAHRPVKHTAARQEHDSRPAKSRAHATSHHQDQSRKAQSRKTRTHEVTKVASGGVWDKIARCESGGDWSINTGNGFYGGLQFTMSTWRAFGGTGKPHHASRSRQIAVAKKIKASQGWGAWPGCTSKLGLR